MFGIKTRHNQLLEALACKEYAYEKLASEISYSIDKISEILQGADIAIFDDFPDPEDDIPEAPQVVTGE
jgi:hypothetical protein